MAWWWWREVVERVVMRGGWGWILCNGFNPAINGRTSSGENRCEPLALTPPRILEHIPLGLPSGLGNGDSAVPVACPPTAVHYNVLCAENL